jgi:hypothetical protein
MQLFLRSTPARLWVNSSFVFFGRARNEVRRRRFFRKGLLPPKEKNGRGVAGEQFFNMG